MDKIEELKLWALVAKDSMLLTNEAAKAAEALIAAGEAAGVDDATAADMRKLLEARKERH